MPKGLIYFLIPVVFLASIWTGSKARQAYETYKTRKTIQEWWDSSTPTVPDPDEFDGDFL